MSENIDKRIRADLFRTRLAEAMRLRATNQSALARTIGVDRSTVSQLLKGAGARLPNAQVVAECARALGVSADWLLGLTARPETAADMLANSLSLTEAPRALVDEQIFAWHKEAAGYKIRHVPAALPDMLKTRAMLAWEYAPSLGRSADQAIGASEDRMAWMRGARSDYEIALPLHENRHASGCTVAIEALSAGVPVVATDAGGIDEYLDGSVHSTLVPRGDLDAFTAAIAVLTREGVREDTSLPRHRGLGEADAKAQGTVARLPPCCGRCAAHLSSSRRARS